MPSWSQLPEDIRRDLLEWFNIVPEAVNRDDKTRLARLYSQGKFEAWYCPGCGARVRCGEPDDWEHFQGVLNPDYSSFPGFPERRRDNDLLCDECRVYGPPNDPWFPDPFAA